MGLAGKTSHRTQKSVSQFDVERLPNDHSYWRYYHWEGLSLKNSLSFSMRGLLFLPFLFRSLFTFFYSSHFCSIICPITFTSSSCLLISLLLGSQDEYKELGIWIQALLFISYVTWDELTSLSLSFLMWKWDNVFSLAGSMWVTNKLMHKKHLVQCLAHVLKTSNWWDHYFFALN